MYTAQSSPKGLLPVLSWDTSRLNMRLGHVYEIGYVFKGALYLQHKYTYGTSNQLDTLLGKGVFHVKCETNQGSESDAAYKQRVRGGMVFAFKGLKPRTAQITRIPSILKTGNLPSASVTPTPIPLSLVWRTDIGSMIRGQSYEIGYIKISQRRKSLWLLHNHNFTSISATTQALGTKMFRLCALSVKHSAESSAQYKARVITSMIASYKVLYPAEEPFVVMPPIISVADKSIDYFPDPVQTYDGTYSLQQEEKCALNLKDRVFMYRLPLEEEPLGSEFNDFHENCLYSPVGGVLSITDEGVTVKFGDYYDDNNEHIAVFPYYVLQFLSKGS